MPARVLIADDDTVVRDVVRRYLERDGLDVTLADDGTEALRVLGTGQIDVAVLDVMMPGPDGLTLCRTLRNAGRYPIPVILLTALGEEDDRIAGLEAGADDYVTKPFSPQGAGTAGAVGAAARVRGGPDVADGDQRRPAEGGRRRPGRFTSRGDQVGLTNREFDLLVFFLHPYRYGVHPRGTAEAGCGGGTSATCRR